VPHLVSLTRTRTVQLPVELGRTLDRKACLTTFGQRLSAGRVDSHRRNAQAATRTWKPARTQARPKSNYESAKQATPNSDPCLFSACTISWAALMSHQGTPPAVAAGSKTGSAMCTVIRNLYVSLITATPLSPPDRPTASV